MVTLPGGSARSFCCCAAVLGVIVLKPEATSMLSLFCVLVCVVAQPTANANRAMTVIMFNETRICFIFICPIQFCGCRGDDFIARKEFTQELSQASWGSVYKTLVQYIRPAERTADARFCSSWATARLFKDYYCATNIQMRGSMRNCKSGRQSSRQARTMKTRRTVLK